MVMPTRDHDDEVFFFRRIRAGQEKKRDAASSKLMKVVTTTTCLWLAVMVHTTSSYQTLPLTQRPFFASRGIPRGLGSATTRSSSSLRIRRKRTVPSTRHQPVHGTWGCDNINRRPGSNLHGLRVELEEGEGLTYDPNGPRITFKARKVHKQTVEEPPSQRTLLEYLALPAEQYSVLDAGTITKKEGHDKSNEFMCVIDPINFLGNTIEATIDAVVDVSPFPKGKSVIRVIGCTLDGSRLARFANGSFDVECNNVVRALREDTRKEKDMPILSVDCQLEISAIVPREGRWLPKRLLGKSGSIVMQQMLNILVPRFVKQLSVDFDAWSAGDDSRAPVATTEDVDGVNGLRDEVNGANGAGNENQDVSKEEETVI